MVRLYGQSTRASTDCTGSEREDSPQESENTISGVRVNTRVIAAEDSATKDSFARRRGFPPYFAVR